MKPFRIKKEEAYWVVFMWHEIALRYDSIHTDNTWRGAWQYAMRAVNA
jgi:hypothetical protein